MPFVSFLLFFLLRLIKFLHEDETNYICMENAFTVTIHSNGLSVKQIPCSVILKNTVDAYDCILTNVMRYVNLSDSNQMKRSGTLFKYSSVFRENKCPPPPKPVYGGHFSHEAVTVKIRSRSPKSNKQLILSYLFRLANLITFHPMVHEITCRQTLFGLTLVD